MAISLSSQFKTEANKQGSKLLVGIKMESLGLYYSCQREFVLGGNTYKDEVKSTPNISQQGDPMGGLATIGNLTFGIDNRDYTSNHFAESGSYPNPEGSAVVVFVIFDDGTPLVESESVQVFKGVLDEFPTVNFDVINFSAVSDDKKLKDILIGDLITDSNNPVSSIIPENTTGKMIPLVFGDNRFKVNYTHDRNKLASEYPFTRNNNLSPCLNLGDDKILISPTQVASISSESDSIWMYDDSLGAMVEVVDWILVQNNAAGCIISIAGSKPVMSGISGFIEENNGSDFVDTNVDFVASGVQVGDVLIIPGDENPGSYTINYVSATELRIDAPYFLALSDDSNIEYSIENYPKFRAWRNPIGITVNQGWLASERMYDKSINLPSFSNVSDQGQFERVILQFDSFPVSRELISTGKLFIKGGCNITQAKMIVNNITDDYFPEKSNDYFHTHNNSIRSHLIDVCPLTHIKTAANSTPTEAAVYEVIQSVEYLKDINSNNMQIYFGGQGISDGGLLENPIDILEWIMRNQLGYGDSGFNLPSIVTAKSELTNWKYSFNIAEQKDAYSFIDNYLKQCGTLGWFNNEDKFTLKVLHGDSTFAYSGTNSPSDDDIFDDDPNVTNYIYDTHMIKERTFNVAKKRKESIITSYKLDYYQNHLDNLISTIEQNSYTYHSQENHKDFKHQFTKEEATAQYFLNFLILTLNKKKWKPQWTTFLNAAGFELVDIINLRHPLLTNLVNSVTSKKWQIFGFNTNLSSGLMSINVSEK